MRDLSAILILVLLAIAIGCIEGVIKPERGVGPEITVPPKTTIIPTTQVPTEGVPTTSPPTTQLAVEGETEGALDLNEANVIDVKFTKDAGGTYTFYVTIRHNDTGWDHYVDWWRIKTLDGEEIARRELAHPHETEQPFTRSLSGIVIPEGIDKVIVEAHDSVHEYGGRTMTVDLTTEGS
ncbi:MAG: hypothetical protein ACE5PM_01250 [Candidatus Hydrothermarchaeales archaeon]